MEREKRSRNKGSSARAAALAKIREARLTGETAEYELGEVENIFDEVNEDEYEVEYYYFCYKYFQLLYFRI